MKGGKMNDLQGLSIEMEKAVETIVNDELVEFSVKFINEKIAETVFKGSIEIGDYVLKLNHLERISQFRYRKDFYLCCKAGWQTLLICGKIFEKPRNCLTQHLVFA